MAGAAAIVFTRQRQTATLGDDGSGLSGDLSAFSRRSPARSETALAVSTAGGPWQRRNLCRICVSGDSNPGVMAPTLFVGGTAQPPRRRCCSAASSGSTPASLLFFFDC
nr:hypothetical protein Iba_chr09eCG14050 [Ipomoea batatas]